MLWTHGVGSSNVYVDDQDKALAFYTDVLGFVKKRASLGGCSLADGRLARRPRRDGAAARTGRSSRGEAVQGGAGRGRIPLTSFGVDDVHVEYERRRALGVPFTQEPLAAGDVTMAVLDDTCGNLIRSRASRRRPRAPS